MLDELLVQAGLPLVDAPKPLQVLARRGMPSVGALGGEGFSETDRVLVGEEGPSAEHVPDPHSYSHFDTLDAVHHEQAQTPVEVDEVLGMLQPQAGSVAAEHTDPHAAFVVDVILGLTERLEVPSEVVVADRL
ncbi:hypothetical protein [Kocuria tytonicola]|uniref:hypothetical protein n=1 Tax=Kocuria tytonicola TaxID=2055946 RepID=UPI001F0C308B|nr:hypothetical protein [Kocuria tytonicola]